MGYNSAIEWTTHTFNPWIGCAKVSTGCKNCYAETLMDTRYGRVEWGVNGTRVRTSPANWRKPLAWNRQAEAAGRRDRVFCASLADVFEDRTELDPWRADLFELIMQTPHLDWLLLTKRPENALPWLNHWIDQAEGISVRPGFVLPNVWLGTSVENQATADERIPHLLRCPAAVRFLSMEPLLGPVDITNRRGIYDVPLRSGSWTNHGARFIGVDWVIIGGESGPGARPFDLAWARSIVKQCRAAGVPVFVKQLGRDPYSTEDRWSIRGGGVAVPIGSQWTFREALRDKKGGDWNEWPEDLRVREMPTAEVPHA